VSVQSLVAADVLAAVVRSHQRTVVLTARGDLVADDQITYENNGIDYLFYAPEARPIYLATDGTSERIMRRDGRIDEILIPLRTGSHSAHVQSLAAAQTGIFGGRLTIPMPNYPLAASGVDLTIGLPRNVHPVVALGGDHTEWYMANRSDVLAILFACAAAMLAFRSRTKRVLGAIALSGAWFVSPTLFVIALASLAATGAIWLASRFVKRAQLVPTGFAIAGFTTMVTFVVVAAMHVTGDAEPHSDVSLRTPINEISSDGRSTQQGWANGNVRRGLDRAEGGDSIGNYAGQGAVAGTIVGVTPVALSLPSSARAVHVRRELVTRQRPLRPVIYYVTDNALIPLLLAWLLCGAALVYLHRRDIARLRAYVRERMTKRPEVPSENEAMEPQGAG
jgi:hypothetical protein